MVWDSTNGWVQIGGDIEEDQEILTGPVETVYQPTLFETYNKGRYRLGKASQVGKRWQVPHHVRMKFQNGFTKDWAETCQKLNERRLTRNTPHRATPKRPAVEVDTIQNISAQVDALILETPKIKAPAKKPHAKRAQSRRRPRSSLGPVDSLSQIPAKNVRRPSRNRISYCEPDLPPETPKRRKRKSDGTPPRAKRSKSTSDMIEVAKRRKSTISKKPVQKESTTKKRLNLSSSTKNQTTTPKSSEKVRKNSRTKSKKQVQKSSQPTRGRRPNKKSISELEEDSTRSRKVTVSVERLTTEQLKMSSKNQDKPEVTSQVKVKPGRKGRRQAAKDMKAAEEGQGQSVEKVKKRGRPKKTEEAIIQDPTVEQVKTKGRAKSKSSKPSKKTKTSKETQKPCPSLLESKSTITPLKLPTPKGLDGPKLPTPKDLTRKEKKDNILKINDINRMDYQAVTPVRKPKDNDFSTPVTSRAPPQASDDFTTPLNSNKRVVDNFSTPAGFTTPVATPERANVFTTPSSFVGNQSKSIFSRTPQIEVTKKGIDAQILAENKVKKKLKPGKKPLASPSGKTSKRISMDELAVVTEVEKENDMPETNAEDYFN